MAPKPQEFSGLKKEENGVRLPGDRIVISGMSGLFPNCHSVFELSEVLYNKVNPVTAEDPRWQFKHPELSNYMGKVPDIEYFDAQFFKVHYRLSNCMDTMCRKVLEQSYQAIYDAGVNPEALSGKKVGVYFGTCFSETDKVCFYDPKIAGGFGIAGCSKAMFANRISYWLNSKGPSMVVEQACCSSSVALELAFQAINRGDCDAALVGGSVLCLHPQTYIQYGRVIPLCKDGKTKSFDQNATGCSKSDAINMIFLQKEKDAVRVYAEVVHVKTEFRSFVECETGPRYGFYRDPLDVVEFMKTFYSEAKVSAKEVEFVEAFGSGMLEADEAELKAIDEIFCKGRSKPLPIGNIMSNIGYTEAASGVSSITKVLLGFEKGEFAGNLNLESPRTDVSAICDGRIKVITDHLPTNHGYVAVNNFSVTGSNAHILLKGNMKPKDPTRYKSSIPRLVAISGRQDISVEKILTDLKKRPIDPEELALFHNIHQTTIPGHLGRGFVILDTNENNETVALSEKCVYYDKAARPLWFVYSGMGSQWAGMGTQLMRIPVFAAAIEKCRRVLEPKGIDIVHIITSTDKTIFDNILHSFVGIAAVQIGLTDILTSIGIIPDKIIGHSVGELGCAYADGCFTAEEMILSAYYRGLVSKQTPFIRGSMAAVGIGYTEAIKLCPPEIEVACHNGSESCTISGPADAMKEFVATLTAKNIFAKEVPCSNIAYHSRYIAEAGPYLHKYLNEVIKNPKRRSERWLSTSVPEVRWNEERAKYSSADYHTNNLLNPVLFEETSRHIPREAVIIEVAPHGLLQAILKRSLPETCTNIALTRRGHPDNARLVLEAIGQLFIEGYNPKIQALYPKVEFPVSTGTPMLAHHVEWAHSELWQVSLFVTENLKTASECRFVHSFHDDEHAYLRGHTIKGVNVYPFTSALMCVWDTLSMVYDMPRRSMSVSFHNVHFTTQPVLHEQRQLRLNVTLHRGTGRFEVNTENTEIASGFIVRKSDKFEETTLTNTNDKDEKLNLTSDDIYTLLKTYECDYTGEWQSIKSAASSLSQAKVIWKNNWVTLIDSIVQLNMLKSCQNASQLDFIRQITLNVEKFKDVKLDANNEALLDAYIFDILDVSRCCGVTLKNVRFRSFPVNNENVSLNAYKFVPHFPAEQSNEVSALSVFFQIVAENLNKDTINALVVNEGGSKFSGLKSIIQEIPGVKVNLASVEKSDLPKLNNINNQIDILLLNDLSSDDVLTETLHNILPCDFFIINKEFSDVKQRPVSLYTAVSSHNIPNAKIQLIRWRPTKTSTISSAVTIHSIEDLDLLKTSLSLLSSGQNLLIVSTYPKVPGLVDLIKQWSKEMVKEDKKIYLVEVNHKVLSEQNLSELPPLNLTFNVLDHGIWGGKYYLPVESQVKKNTNVILQTSCVGNIDSLTWMEAPELTGTGMDVKVHYATLNSLDAKRCTGVIPVDSESTLTFGMDFSGVTKSGVRVMGIVQTGALSSVVRVKSEQLWPVPAHWTLEEAATVPLAYSFAFYCLTRTSTLKPGLKILVHGGTGALAQAVISIALAFNCEVFTTVSNQKKKQFLRKLFPQLKENHIGNSRDHTFKDMVMAATKSVGCDIIISSATKEYRPITLSCLSTTGVYYDISLLQERENYVLGMNYIDCCRSYTTIDLSCIFSNESIMKRLQGLVIDGIARGYVRPLTRITFAPSDVTRAFHLLAGNRHYGRVLVDMQQPIPAIRPRLQLSSEVCNVIISDDDMLAMQLADRLVLRGAKQLYIQAPRSNAFLVKQRSWNENNVHVVLDGQGLWNKTYADILINKSSVLGKVEVMYMIVSKHQRNNDVSDFLDNLVTAFKKLKRDTKLAVIDVGDRISDDAFTSSSNSHLKMTIIKLPLFETAQVSLTTSKLKAIEHALNSKEPVIVVPALPLKDKSLLKDIARIAKIDLPTQLENTLTLKDLCEDPVALLPLRGYLREKYNIVLSEEAIPYLTISKIKELQENLIDSGFKAVQGFANFYSYADSDELLGTTEMCFLSTLLKSSAMQDHEFDVNQKFLCLVPGVEGHHERFSVLCERLKLFALVLQPGLDHRDETPQELAARYTKILMKKTGLKGHFYLLGYESGVIVALEMAKILEEQEGLTGTVFCLGGTPEDVISEFNFILNKYKTGEELQDELIKHVLQLNLGDENANIELKGTWEEKLSSYHHYLKGKVPLSSQYTRKYIECAYARLNQIRKCKIQIEPLKSQLIFLRPKLALPSSDSPQKYSEKPVVVYDLKSPWGTVAKDLQCSAIINRHLDAEILKTFDNTNLCYTYTIKNEMGL